MWEVSNLDTSSSGWLPLILMLFSWAGKPFPLGSSSWGFHVPVPLSGVVLGMEWIVFSVYSECGVSGFWGRDGVWDGWRGCIAPFARYYLGQYQVICVVWLLHQSLQEVLCFQILSGSTKDWLFSFPIWNVIFWSGHVVSLWGGAASMLVCCLVWGWHSDGKDYKFCQRTLGFVGPFGSFSSNL